MPFSTELWSWGTVPAWPARSLQYELFCPCMSLWSAEVQLHTESGQKLELQGSCKDLTTFPGCICLCAEVYSPQSGAWEPLSKPRRDNDYAAVAIYFQTLSCGTSAQYPWPWALWSKAPWRAFRPCFHPDEVTEHDLLAGPSAVRFAYPARGGPVLHHAFWKPISTSTFQSLKAAGSTRFFPQKTSCVFSRSVTSILGRQNSASFYQHNLWLGSIWVPDSLLKGSRVLGNLNFALPSTSVISTCLRISAEVDFLCLTLNTFKCDPYQSLTFLGSGHFSFHGCCWCLNIQLSLLITKMKPMFISDYHHAWEELG